MKIWAAFKADGSCVMASALAEPDDRFMLRAKKRGLQVRFVEFSEARSKAPAGFRKCFKLLGRELDRRAERANKQGE